MTDQLIRAALYVRVSTTRQAEADLSIPDQVKQLTAYCERKGWQVAETYIEPGASALDDDRPIFQEMIAAATSSEHPYDHIVVHSLSRFSRDVLDSALYGRKLEKAAVSLVSITQELGDDTNGKLIRTILNAFDEHSSRENAKHTHRAMMENARQGFWNGSRPPFGYAVVVKERRGNKDKKVLVINEVEAQIVRLIFDIYLGRHGKALGIKAICCYLNEHGITRRGHKWGIGSLQDLMTNSAYCGHHLFNRIDSRTGRVRLDSECVEVAVPTIIAEEDFERVRAALHARSPRMTPPRVVNGPTMLAGVARCAHCGAAMVLNTGKGVYRYYACSGKARKGDTVCKGQRRRGANGGGTDTMMKEWMSAAEIAVLKLRDMPESESGVWRIAKRDGWQHPERQWDAVTNPLGVWRKRDRKQGGGVEYHYSLLPARAQSQLLVVSAVPPEALPAAAKRSLSASDMWAWFDRQTDKVKGKAQERLAILTLVEAMARNGQRKEIAVALIAAEKGVAGSSVWGWYKRVAGQDRDDWLPFLADQYVGRQVSAEFDDDAWEAFKADFLRLSPRPLSACYRDLKLLAARKGWAIPSEKSVARRVERDIHPTVLVLTREGPEALKRMYPPQERDRSCFHAVEAINGDGHIWDVRVEWPDGTIGRPVMVGFQDLYSNKLLASGASFPASPTPSSLTRASDSPSDWWKCRSTAFPTVSTWFIPPRW